MNLTYTAYTGDGETATGRIEASSAAEATSLLAKRGLFVTHLSEEGESPDGADRSRVRKAWRPTGRVGELLAFTRQLAVLIPTGTTLVDAISASERQHPGGPFKEVLRSLRTSVEEGEPLAAAMRQHAQWFDPVYRALISAGEAGGQLAPMLSRLSTMIRHQAKLRSTIAASMTYPVLLSVVSVVVVAVMLAGVLPRFKSLFASLDAPVPPFTLVLMNVGIGLRTYWWAPVIVVASLTVVAVWLVRSPRAARVRSSALLSAPLIGRLYRSLVIARLIRTLGVLLECRVPLVESLELAADAADCAPFAKLVERSKDAVLHGESLHSIFGTSPLIGSGLAEAISTGERTGRLGFVLLSLADSMDEDNEQLIRSLTSILEPMILIVLGVIVGVVAVSLFLPLFDLTSAAHT